MDAKEKCGIVAIARMRRGDPRPLHGPTEAGRAHYRAERKNYEEGVEGRTYEIEAVPATE